MKDFCNKFLSLLRYVPYVVDEKPKIQCFLSCLPTSYKDRIEFDNPKTLEEAMRKSKLCFEQYKTRNENSKNWKGKKVERFDPRRKEGMFFNKNTEKGFRGNNYKNNKPYNLSDNKNTKPTTFYNKETSQKEPVKCWECGEPHYFKGCPHGKKKNNNIHIVREATTVCEIAWRTPKINAALGFSKLFHKL